MSLYRSIRQRFKHPAIDWQLLFALVCIILEIARMEVGHISRGTLFYPSSPHYWTRILIVLTTLSASACR